MTLVDPALPPSITSRLAGGVPVSIQLDVPWQAISSARSVAKQTNLPPTPSLMLSWCVTRALAKHPAFCRLVQPDGKIVEQADSDLGLTVALAGDRQATAVIPKANKLDWTSFVAAYGQAVAKARAGQVVEPLTPLVITCAGGFGIEVATPIIVPPAMGTLFAGQAHVRMITEGGIVSPVEVVTLSLTFDHRVVNGAGAAAFLQEVSKLTAGFKLPG